MHFLLGRVFICVALCLLASADISFDKLVAAMASSKYCTLTIDIGILTPATSFIFVRVMKMWSIHVDRFVKPAVAVAMDLVQLSRSARFFQRNR